MRSVQTSYGLVTPAQQRRFWSYVDRTADGCWLWGGYVMWAGYGQFNLRHGHPVRAHKLAYELTHGPVPKGLDVRHRCDVRACIRPTDLLPGTRTQNMADAVSRNRTCAGEARSKKLTQADVDLIRELYAVGDISQSALANRFGVSQPVISRITRRRTWRRTAA